MQNLNQLTPSSTMQEACNSTLNTTSFPPFKEWQNTLDKHAVIKQQSDFVKEYMDAHSQSGAMQDQYNLRLQALDAFTLELYKPYVDAFTTVVTKLVELGLAEALIPYATKYYDKWHEYNTIGEFIVMVNQAHCKEANVDRITLRALTAKSGDETKKQNAGLYDQYIKFRNDHNATVDEARATLKHVKKRHAQDTAELKEEVRANIAKYKLEQERRLVDLDQTQTQEVIELKRIINLEVPSSFEAYKSSLENETE